MTMPDPRGEGEALAGCPGCGLVMHNDQLAYQHLFFKNGKPDEMDATVICLECGWGGPCGDNDADAAAKWNRRTPSLGADAEAVERIAVEIEKWIAWIRADMRSDNVGSVHRGLRDVAASIRALSRRAGGAR